MAHLKSIGYSAERQLRRVCAELQRLLQAGEKVRAEDYFARFPFLAIDADLGLDLIYTEYLARVELERQALREEFFQRFPHWRETLERQFEWHEMLGETVAPELVPSSVTPYSFGPTAEEGRGEGLPWSSRFEILREIGRGAMGVVYQAWQATVNRIVAVKMILAGAQATPQDLARFRVEAEAVARLQHAHIIQIYEVGQQEQCPFIVLEYVAGGSLAQRMTGQPWSSLAAAQLVEKLARAVHYAHQMGIVHRDLSPANVLLTEKGEPKITDFGLAKLLIGGDTTATKTGAVLGTPNYMAPEQAEGKTKEIGPAADIHALGAILYELLTGCPPFQAESVLSTLDKVRWEEPLRPRRLQANVPRDLQTICLKCLRKEPQRRYATAQLLADDLRRFSTGQPIQASLGPPWERGLSWAKRQPALATLLALLLALCAIGLGLARWYG